MRKFSALYDIAAKRKGGPNKLEALLASPLSEQKLARVTPAAWLDAMAKAVFQAGFNWQLIEEKWPAFRAAFDEFDPARVAFYDDADIDRLLADKSIVRNSAKITSVVQNAQLLIRLDKKSGNASRKLAFWPIEGQHELLELLSKEGSRLGGITGQRVCRMVGRDTYVLSPDVCKRLTAEGAFEGAPTSKKAMTAIQKAFNSWRAESGKPLTQISQVLAMSVD
jgi:3-methyladenine DNA glycosylase Tag